MDDYNIDKHLNNGKKYTQCTSCKNIGVLYWNNNENEKNIYTPTNIDK